MTNWTPIGQMRSRVTVQVRAAGQDAAGQPSDVWANVYENVPARCSQMGGSEQFAGQQLQPQSVWEVRMRYLPGLTPLHRLLVAADTRETSAHVLDILNLSDLESRHRELLITCKERVLLPGEESAAGATGGIPASLFATKHYPVESPDGQRTSFTFVGLPSSSYLVVWNGLIQSVGLSQDGEVITMPIAPSADDTFYAYY